MAVVAVVGGGCVGVVADDDGKRVAKLRAKCVSILLFGWGLLTCWCMGHCFLTPPAPKDFLGGDSFE